MEKDIVPELVEKILQSYEERIAADKRLQSFFAEVAAGEGEQDEASQCATRIGRHAAEAYVEYVKEENMPNGRLYWNIIERTLTPLIERVYERVNGMTMTIQEGIDKKKGIGIKLVPAKFPKDRMDGLMNKIIAMFNNEEVEEEEDERDI